MANIISKIDKQEFASHPEKFHNVRDFACNLSNLFGYFHKDQISESLITSYNSVVEAYDSLFSAAAIIIDLEPSTDFESSTESNQDEHSTKLVAKNSFSFDSLELS